MWVGGRCLDSSIPAAPPPPIVCHVPDLIDDLAKSVEPQLHGATLRLGRVSNQESTYRESTVVRQVPPRGAEVKCGSAVDIWIAVPPPQPPPPIVCHVPDLIEDLARSIEPQLEGATLRLGRVSNQESTHREGTVVRQVPSRGAEVKCGSAVDIWIAVPPPQPPPPIVCHVPDLSEDLEPAIEAQLARAQLRLRNRTDQESNLRSGTMLRQLPTAGVAVKCGSGVDVWIAVPEPVRPEPPKPVSVPPLEGRDQMAATRVLEAAGLHLGAVGRRPSDGPRDLVVAQAPAPARRCSLAASAGLARRADPDRSASPRRTSRSRRSDDPPREPVACRGDTVPRVIRTGRSGARAGAAGGPASERRHERRSLARDADQSSGAGCSGSQSTKRCQGARERRPCRWRRSRARGLVGARHRAGSAARTTIAGCGWDIRGAVDRGAESACRAATADH